MIQDFINQLEKKEDLDFHSMQSAIESIMTGAVDDHSIEAFLLALNEKGIQEIEITAAARVMKEKSLQMFHLQSHPSFPMLAFSILQGFVMQLIGGHDL